MSFAPFSPSPARFGNESRRARVALAAAAVGIAAALLAYAFSPGVRHVVGHAAHSVNHTVSNFFDHDQKEHALKHRSGGARTKNGITLPRRVPAYRHGPTLGKLR